MSHYLLKLNNSFGNYLAEVQGYITPQWQPREYARKFAKADDAREYLKALHLQGLDYPAHIVFLRTSKDLKAERVRLREAALAVIEYEWGTLIAIPAHQPLWRNLAECVK